MADQIVHTGLWAYALAVPVYLTSLQTFSDCYALASRNFQIVLHWLGLTRSQ